MSAAKLPAWLPDGCPPWCDATALHAVSDYLEDRSHTGVAGEVILTACEPVAYSLGLPAGDEPEMLRISLIQHYREIEPRVWVGRNDTNVGVHLTLEEAERLAEELRRVAAIGRE